MRYRPIAKNTVSDEVGSAWFSNQVIEWYQHSGRKNLPWQLNPTPYEVWLSEIMLQQTQVATVIPYFNKFIQTFPNIKTLAQADLDAVLAHWQGLGYYARARNLHKTAKIIVDQYQANFPTDIEQVIKLPGIGRSTAGAILSLSLNQPHPILDGNVKRVIARFYGIKGWSGKASILKVMWSKAELITPKVNTKHFNQAMMDMGATVCVRSNPLCGQCCLESKCYANKNDSWHLFPSPKPKKKRPLKQAYVVQVIYKNSIYLEKRPPTGIWGSLWSLPEFETECEAKAWLETFVTKSKALNRSIQKDVLLHRFSHFDLNLNQIILEIKEPALLVAEGEKKYIKYNELKNLGLPTPIKKLISLIQ